MVEIIRKHNKKTKPQKPQLQKELLAGIGKRLYEFDGVENVAIYVEFKDGTGMKFRKGKDDD